MLRTVVIYKSISSFTKQYATWIAEDLHVDIYNAKEIKSEKLTEYSLIIFGGSLHATGINGVKTIKENLPLLKDKKVIVFGVSASPPREGLLEEIKDNNFSAEEQKHVRLFYLRGCFNYDKLDRTNKILIALFKVRLSLKRKRTPDEKGMLAAYAKQLDCTRKENIKGLMECANTLA